MKQTLIVLLCSLLALTCADFATPVAEETSGFGGRILGGSAATAGSLPWHVWVRSTLGTSSVTCGGTLIASNWVLTAAHCVQGYTSFSVGAGSNSLASPQVQLTAVSYVVNPNYNSANYNNDVALLQLPAALSNSTVISPIRLPAISQTNTTFVNFGAIVSGFGRLNNATTVLSDSLQMLNMNVIGNVNCANVYGTAVVTDNVLCAQGTSNSTFGTCLGDSGGPLIIYESSVPTLIGTVSFISGRGCGAGDPSGFARVSRFLTWINAVTGIPLRA